MNRTNLDPALSDLLKRLIDVYSPRQIYLYGSRVWGTPQIDSDFDIFVIVESSEFDQAERIRIGTRALIGTGYNVDLLILTEKEIITRKDHPSTLTHKVLTKGIKLYDAA